METTITGKTLLARLRFVAQELGAADAKRVLGKLPPDDQRLLGGIILPVGRYPLALNARRIGAMRRLYYGEGELGYERTSATSAHIFVRGMATVTTPDCESTAGFYEVAITRSGGRDPHVVHRCRLDGAPDCTFDCSWRI